MTDPQPTARSSQPSDLSWILNHLGEDRENYFNAVAPPIIQSSIFAWPTVDAMRQGFSDELVSHMYTRGNNPTVEILRRKVAALEGAEDCLMFGSGAGAISAAVIGSLKGGDHAVCVARPYSWTRTVLNDLLGRFGVATTFVDGTDVANFENALTGATRLIVLESPNSMTFEQQDLSAVARLAKARGIRTLCDNSYATPLNQSPLALGIDLVAHSATKYLNGHSDVVAGALCGRHEIIHDIFRGPFMTLGALLAPNDAWLMIRGLRTLPLRMQRIAETTAKVLAFIQAHPKVRRVHSPRAIANAQLALTEKQLRGASGLLTLELDAPDVASVERFCDALKRFLMTVSWGGYESLLFPVAAAHPAGTPLVVPGGVAQNFVRLSIGLEESDVLIRDLDVALGEL